MAEEVREGKHPQHAKAIAQKKDVFYNYVVDGVDQMFLFGGGADGDQQQQQQQQNTQT